MTTIRVVANLAAAQPLDSDLTDLAANPTSYLNPPGVMAPYAGIVVPTGWLLCDGSSVSKATYAALWAALSAVKGTATITIASPGVVTLAAHGLRVYEQVYFTTTGALPTGLAANTSYYAVPIDANTFRLSLTQNGPYINTSGSQSGVHTLVLAPFGVASSTNFKLPDTRGRVIAGIEPSAGYFTGLGVVGGELLHLLTTAEIPSHVHANTIVATQYETQLWHYNAFSDWSNHPSLGQTGSINNVAAGGGGAHNNVQPYLSASHIIKT